MMRKKITGKMNNYNLLSLIMNLFFKNKDMKVKIKDTFIGENSERLNNVEIFLFFQTILILQN